MQPLTRDAVMGRYQGMTAAEREQREVYAVTSGAPVTYSSFRQYPDTCFIHYELDYNHMVPNSWSGALLAVGQWIQVSQENPRLWTGVIMQGRGDSDQWVKSIKIAHTLKGKFW